MGKGRRPLSPSGIACLVAGCHVIACSPAAAQQGADKSDAATTNTDLEHGTEAEIVVTARRRVELLQRAPVSVIALSSAQLEARSVSNLRSLQYHVPNLTFAASQNVGEAAGNIFIRGIGQEDFGVGAEPGVGFYIDGVYIARTTGTLANLTDVDRIEVLRGPQGTLFGKNSIGGAVNLISVGPRPRPEGRFSAIVGNYNRVELRAVINQPLTDHVFARLALATVDRDGYLRRLAPAASLGAIEEADGAPIDTRREGGERSRGGRLQLRWLANDRLTFDLVLDGSHRRNTQGATHLDAINPNVGALRQINRLIQLGQLPGPQITPALVRQDLLESDATGENLVKQGQWGASLAATKEIGHNSVKLIAAYRGQRNRLGTDLDGLHFNILESNLRANQRQFSGELKLDGEIGALTYTVGLFAFREVATLDPSVSIMSRILYTCGCFYPPGSPPSFETDRRRLGSASYAGFGQGTYKLSPRLAATLGARLTHERKSLDGRAFRLDADLEPTDSVIASGASRDAWTSLTYRAGVEFQARPTLMAFASVARGYKSGGFNVRGRSDLPNLGFTSFKPETARTLEAGLRSEWLDRRLRLNATLFHTDYRDIQLRRQTIVDGLVTTAIENAASARIRGVEAELTVMPARGLTVRAAYGHIAARYLDVGRVPGLTLSSRFQRTPAHSLSASVEYQARLGPSMIELHGDYSYRSKEQFQITAADNDQRAYGLLGARVTLRMRADRWSFALFGTNLTDERYRTAGRGTLFNQVGLAYSSIGMPRQVGFQIARKY